MALPGPHRIKGQKAFDFLYQQGRRHHGAWMVLRVVPARPALLKPGSPGGAGQPVTTGPTGKPGSASGGDPAQSWRCAVVISNKVSKRAVRRNRLRRLLHQHLQRTLAPAASDSAPWLLISLKPGSVDAEPAALLGECDQLLQQAGLRP